MLSGASGASIFVWGNLPEGAAGRVALKMFKCNVRWGNFRCNRARRHRGMASVWASAGTRTCLSRAICPSVLICVNPAGVSGTCGAKR